MERNRFTGKIIFWNGIYGFIELVNGGSYFFHKKNLAFSYPLYKVRLFDIVQFSIEINRKGLYAGKTYADNIEFVEAGSYKDYERLVGKLESWNGRYGYIASPNLDNKVLLYNTRITEVKSNQIRKGDSLIFNRVKSAKGGDQLFAFFAYPLYAETDLAFLEEKFQESRLTEVRDQLQTVLQNQQDKSPKEKFKFEVGLIESLDSIKGYQALKQLIKKYKSSLGDIVIWDLLKSLQVPEKYLIQLWWSEVINSFDVETFKYYFVNAKAADKRFMAYRFNTIQKEEILEHYYNILLNAKKLDRINNDLKTLLDLAFRIPQDSNSPLYIKIKQHISNHLSDQEMVDLWVHGYLDSLSENLIVENFDLNNLRWIELVLEKGDHTELIEKIFEEYFLTFDQDGEEKRITDLIAYLLIFQDKFQDRGNEIINVLRVKLDDHQNFLLWLFGVRIDFDGEEYFDNNHLSLNHYFKLKYLLMEEVEIQPYQLIDVDISENGLIDFALSYTWDNLISPTEFRNQASGHYFLQDVDKFESEFEFGINVKSIASTLFHHLPKYTVHHLRLWLYKYVDDEAFSYVGFRDPFKELSRSEQQSFKERSRPILDLELETRELETVVPCTDFEENVIGTRTYSAIAENIYFSNKGFRLRKEDGAYTEEKKEEYANRDWNRIPKSSIFNMIPIIVKVSSSGKIISKNALEELVTVIHTSEIERALQERKNENEPGKISEDESYLGDWKLKKEVIAHLEQHRSPKFEILNIEEPRNRYRRIDEDSEDNDYETCSLITFETADGLAIIWENLDYSEDRATFIFKTKAENYSQQINKIKHTISSYAQLRSTLISRKEDPKLKIFKDNLGYVASIRKRRGKNKPFSSWVDNFYHGLSMVIPMLPTEEEMEMLKGWKLEVNSYTPKWPEVYSDDDVEEIDFDFGQGEGKSERKKKNRKTKSKNHTKIINSLKSFNDSFLKGLKI